MGGFRGKVSKKKRERRQTRAALRQTRAAKRQSGAGLTPNPGRFTPNPGRFNAKVGPVLRQSRAGVICPDIPRRRERWPGAGPHFLRPKGPGRGQWAPYPLPPARLWRKTGPGLAVFMVGSPKICCRPHFGVKRPRCRVRPARLWRKAGATLAKSGPDLALALAGTTPKWHLTWPGRG